MYDAGPRRPKFLLACRAYSWTNSCHIGLSANGAEGGHENENGGCPFWPAPSHQRNQYRIQSSNNMPPLRLRWNSTAALSCRQRKRPARFPLPVLSLFTALCAAFNFERPTAATPGYPADFRGALRGRRAKVQALYHGSLPAKVFHPDGVIAQQTPAGGEPDRESGQRYDHPFLVARGIGATFLAAPPRIAIRAAPKINGDDGRTSRRRKSYRNCLNYTRRSPRSCMRRRLDRCRSLPCRCMRLAYHPGACRSRRTAFASRRSILASNGL